jgi:hypothetical protein
VLLRRKVRIHDHFVDHSIKSSFHIHLPIIVIPFQVLVERTAYFRINFLLLVLEDAVDYLHLFSSKEGLKAATYDCRIMDDY